jgi:hypothetical protein
MSHSLHRATPRRLSVETCGVAAGMLPDSFCSQTWTYRAKDARWQQASGGGQNVRAPLRSRFEQQSIQQQQDHCADDRHNPASDIIRACEDASDPGAN